MPSERHRRSVLSAGVGALAALSGCVLLGPESVKEGSDDDGDGAGPSPGSDGTTTSGTPRTYSFQVENFVERRRLSRAGTDRDTPATVTLEVKNDVTDDTALFEREVTVAPGETRTVEDAFTTEPGESYFVTVELERFLEPSRLRPERNYVENTNWENGGFGVPEDTTIEVDVVGAGDEILRPQIDIA